MPGGFIELGETSVEAVIRELREETGIGVIPREVLMVDTTIGGFYGDVVVIAYEITLESSEFTPGDDALEVRYFNYDVLPRLTFLSHKLIIDRAFEGLETQINNNNK
ncbi:MAG: NUDIX hydrolase [Candidatus Marinimicrobia bacterium]|nr:NUDIX hydrolase [Candidatus Neomarinimicrobiota bacterium]